MTMTLRWGGLGPFCTWDGVAHEWFHPMVKEGPWWPFKTDLTPPTQTAILCLTGAIAFQKVRLLIIWRLALPVASIKHITFPPYNGAFVNALPLSSKCERPGLPAKRKTLWDYEISPEGASELPKESTYTNGFTISYTINNFKVRVLPK